MARRLRTRYPALLVALCLLVGGLFAGPTVAQAACHPIRSTPVFTDVMPTAQEILGFELGSEEVTAEESDTYLNAIAEASDRVVAGTAGFSVENRPLRYAIVGAPGNVSEEGLAAIQASIDELRDPETTDEEAADLAATTPAILLVQANVHGGEESGTESSLQLLFELADRDDCVTDTILENAIVVIMPVQNPDGRDADTRRNAYGIDMNRDWFARTQPESDAKLELLRQYPPVLDLDVHEMGAYTYFFPPNSDPIYHEIADVSNDWINELYGPAMAAEFDRQKIRYFNYEPYDFFGVFYGDTVPTVAFHGAGMTFEKQSSDPLPVRMYEQYVTSIVSVFEAASNKDEILTDWHASWVDAFEQGEAGTVEPNAVTQKGHTVIEDPPEDAFVRHYFLARRRGEGVRGAAADPAPAADGRRALPADRAAPGPRLPRLRPAGGAHRAPAGTYWIPMAQARKHWVQSMLNEDTYIPHDVTYDVTGWSNPLLMNVPGGFSAAELEPVAEPGGSARGAGVAVRDGRRPGRRGVLGTGQTASSRAARSGGCSPRSGAWTPTWFPTIRTTRIGPVDGAGHRRRGAGRLRRPRDAGRVPELRAERARREGEEGARRVDEQRRARDRVGRERRGGTRIGVSTAVLQRAHTNMPGSLVRVALDETSPLAEDVGRSRGRCSRTTR